MVNYGWKKTEKDGELYLEIEKYVATLPTDSLGGHARVELNGTYGGVCVRRLTHYPDIMGIVKALDAIYDRVVG